MSVSQEELPVRPRPDLRRLPKRALLIGGVSAVALAGLLVPAIHIFSAGPASVDAPIAAYTGHAHHTHHAAMTPTAITADAPASTMKSAQSKRAVVITPAALEAHRYGRVAQTHGVPNTASKSNEKHAAYAMVAAAPDTSADTGGDSESDARAAAQAGFTPAADTPEVRIVHGDSVPRTVLPSAVIADASQLVSVLHSKSGEYCGMRSDRPMRYNFTQGYLLCVVREHGAVRSNLLRREPDGHFTFLGGTHGVFTRQSLASYFTMPPEIAEALLMTKTART